MRRVLAPHGTLSVHLDQREASYVKVLLDGIFGRACFLNEVIWAYDYGGRSRRRRPAKRDTILVYVKDPRQYVFDAEAVERISYVAPVVPRHAAAVQPPGGGALHGPPPRQWAPKAAFPVDGTVFQAKPGHRVQNTAEAAPAGAGMLDSLNAPAELLLDPLPPAAGGALIHPDVLHTGNRSRMLASSKGGRMALRPGRGRSQPSQTALRSNLRSTATPVWAAPGGL